VHALFRHWRQHPRLEWLAAGYLGFKPPAETAPEDNERQLEKLAAMFGLRGKGSVSI
jgi:hypothetical protein